MNEKQQIKLNAEQQKIVEGNFGLVYYLVNKMGIPQNEFEDVISIGTIGLVKAALSFDETKGIRFTSYASRCINNEIFMYYRKEKKQMTVVTSLDTPIDEDGKLSLIDAIYDSEEDFTKQIETKIIFTDVINFILNNLYLNEKYVTLYFIAEVRQKEIARKLNLSQSCVSKLLKKSHLKIKKFLRNGQHSKEIFHVSIGRNSYKITFSSADIKDFDEIFSSFIRKLDPKKDLINYQIVRTLERVTIIVPGTKESFKFIAELIEEIDNFTLQNFRNND